MKFKQHLQENLEQLEHEIKLDDVWTSIEKQTKAKSFPRKQLMIGFVLIGLITIIALALKNQSDATFEPTFTEVKKPVLFAKFDSENAADRTHLLSATIETEKDEMQIAEALIYVIENDESVQVKLTAARALKDYTHLETVRMAIIEQMAIAKEDYLKITLINLLTKGKIKDGIPALNQLLDDDQTAKLVKLEAEQSELDLIKM